MPANPNRDTQRARMFIMNQLSKIPKDGTVLKQLELRVLVSFPVSDAWPGKFIKEYFVDLGEYEINDGIIKRCA